jgi:hypothetical protein
MSGSLRDRFTAAVKPLLPDGWRFIPNQSTPEKITVVTVVLKHLEISPLEQAPRDHLGSSLVLTVLSPLGDDIKAENELDDAVLDLAHALQAVASWVRLDRAKKIRDATTDRLGWDLELTAITNTRPE